MARRKNDTQSAIETIIALVVFLASVAFLAWLPFRRATGGTLFVGVLGIIGGLVSLMWWVGTHEAPPPDLKVLAAISGGLYGLALLMRIVTGARDEFEDIEGVEADSLPLRRGEVVLYEGVAQFLGDRRRPIHFGVSFPIAGRVRGGVGTTVPITSLEVVDQGTLVVTNQRVLLVGRKRTRTLKGGRLLGATVEDAHVVIRPENGGLVVAAVRDPQAVAEAVQSLTELSI